VHKQRVESSRRVVECPSCWKRKARRNDHDTIDNAMHEQAMREAEQLAKAGKIIQRFRTTSIEREAAWLSSCFALD
jgi:hypothetical protein